ncbi:MAG: CBS domain-containing protein [Acidobacteria bacterium]|nr:CBS domain-containing protein [Acidobacteriota bacterium]
MKVKEIMTAYVTSCGPNATLVVAAGVMQEYNCGSLPVMDGGGKVIGMITDHDICLAVSKKDHDVSRIKSSEIISGKVYDCAPTDDVKDALKTMRKKKAPCLPVVDGAGALKGILSIDDILLHARKAKGKKSRKLSYKDAARTFQAISKPRLLKLAKSSRVKKAARQEIGT